jgi:hypothetical protein
MFKLKLEIKDLKINPLGLFLIPNRMLSFGLVFVMAVQIVALLPLGTSKS